MAPVVRGQVPRKQGLKPYVQGPVIDGAECPRASSKKTRIETNGIKGLLLHFRLVRGQVPRKQGLKPARPKPERPGM